jgi:4-hydroxythreonine-4-phosphate dehydrogenase
MGDPAGIGMDIVLAALQRPEPLPPFVLIADPAVVAARAKLLSVRCDIQVTTEAAIVAGTDRGRLTLLPVGCAAPVVPGVPDPANAPAIIGAIEQAASLVHSGDVSAVVTNPIAKHVLQSAGFAHPGHTEFLGELARRYWGVAAQPIMMLAAPELRVVLATIHVALSRVPGLLTQDLIVRTARTTLASLARDFGIARPRLAVAGLNPHAGENGLMGTEDEAIIRPAVAQLVAEGHDVTGPYPPDTLFHAAARARYDAVLAMYHDQGLIPLKTLAFDHGVNVTLGLPFVRTSPDHGTAFDIAGSGRALPTSFIAALHLAADMAQRRRGQVA